MKIILVLFSVVVNAYLNFQTFEGKYIGSFLGNDNIVTIEQKNNELYIATIVVSKTSFVLDCTSKGESLIFFMPLNDGSELEVKAALVNDDLELSFTLDEKFYTTLLKRIDKKGLPTSRKEKHGLDSNLFGKWIVLGRHDNHGGVIQSDSYSKRYYRIFTKDGRLIIDPQKFRDDYRKNGIPFSFQDLPPPLNWRTKESNKIVISFPGVIEFEEKYFFQGDSLILVTDEGYKTFLIRDKQEK